MKKILICLLCALIIFSFASCEKDKGEDSLQVYEEYKKTMNLATLVTRLNHRSDAKCNIGKDDISVYDLTPLLKELDSKYEKAAITVTSASGVLEQNNTATGNTESMKNWEIKYSFTPEGSTTATEETLTLSLEYKREINTSRGGAVPETVSYDFTVNGKKYSVSYSTSVEGEKSIFIKASVNGKSVDVNLLNSSGE